MATQPENSKVVQPILKFLKEYYPGWYRKIHGGPFQRRGIPDIVGCHRGRFISIEAKMEGNEASALQRKEGRLIRKAGGLWIVAYSVQDVRQLMEEEFKDVRRKQDPNSTNERRDNTRKGNSKGGK